MHLLDDFRQAWRSLSGSPGFLLLSSGVLALGLATTIFMYGVTHTMLDKAPPFPQAEQLVTIKNSEPARDSFGDDFSYPDFGDIAASQRSMQSLSAAYTGTMTFSGSGLPERVSGAFVAASFFELLRVAPALGRGFSKSDHLPGATPTVMLSHDLWRTRFVSDPLVLGKSVRVNGELSTIVGVMPAGFAFPSRAELAWAPIRRDPASETRGDPNGVGVQLFGRLRDGVTLQQARAEFDNIGNRLAQRFPKFNAGKAPFVQTLAHGVTGQEGVQVLMLLFYVVWGVLAIACANVASLIFVRANHRVYEASMRAALGAKRARLVTLVLAESLIIAGVGGLIGLALAAVGLDVMRRTMASLFEGMPSWWTYNIDWAVAGFAIGAALLAGIAAGIWPAWRASRPDVMRILRDGGRTGTGMRLSLFTTIMVVIEVALAVVLLSGAGVATRTALLTLSRDSGVSAQGFMTGRVMLPEASYNDAARADFWPRAVLELASQPGVLAATAATVMPGAGTGNSTVAIEGATYPDRASFPVAQDVAITAGFFAAFDSRLLAGRDFNSGDRMGSLPVVIVNQAFSTAHFPQGDAVGKRIRINAEEPDAPWLTIIGVAPNINHDDSWDRLGVFEPVVYSTLTQLPIRFVTIAVRVAGDPRRYADLLRQTIGRMESESPVYFLGTLQERQDKPRGGMKIIAGMFTVFAVVAILLAAVGLYGVLAFTIGQRNREIGIRRAMGARNGQVLQAVLRAALVQLAIGLAIGALLAPLLTAALPNFVTGGYPHDVWVYAIVFALVALCALLASWVPALRALGVQPAVALRYE